MKKNKLMGFILALLLACLSGAAHAQKAQQQVHTFENNTASIEVQCLNADLKVIHDKTSALKIGTQVFEGQKPVEESDWTISVSKDPIKNKIQVHCRYPQKVFVDKKLETQYRYNIIIRGPSTDLKVNSRAGKVAINGWNQPSQIVVENGTIDLDKTASNFRLNMITGVMDVKGHVGRLTVDAFDAKMNVSQVDGNLDATNFMGASQLKAIKGNVTITSKKGSTFVEGSGGALKFDTDEGKLDLQYGGAIEGVTQETQITAKLTNPARFKATIRNANIKLSVPSSSGAQVYMALNEGQFQTPNHLTRDENGSLKIIKGTLRGGESGRISVTGEAGKINLNTF